MFRQLSLLVSLVLVFALSGIATASIYWTGGGGDNYWSNASNWGADDGDGFGWNILDLEGATALVDATHSATAGDATHGAWIGKDNIDITLNITGGSLTSEGRTRVAYMPGSIATVNISGDGSFISNHYLRIAQDTDSNCTINMTDNATWDILGDEKYSYIRIGDEAAGNGTINITDDASMNVLRYIRNAYKSDSTGNITISGNGRLNVEGHILAADQGTGVLTVEDNGVVDINDSNVFDDRNGLYVPFKSAGTATVNLRGGTIYTPQLVMEDGTGLVDIWDGTLVIDGNAVSTIHNYIDAGKIAAAGVRKGEPGFGTIIVDYDGSKTTVTAFSLIAFDPSPSRGKAVIPNTSVTLTWSSGRDANSHDVYFGTSFKDVNDANTSNTLGVYMGNQPLADTHYGPVYFEIGQTYYWRVDEVNDPNIWQGNIWVIAVANYLIVDDFESYDSSTNKIFSTWEDGNVNLTGSFIDLGVEPFNPAHTGNQSMQYIYDNTIKWDWDHYWSEGGLPFASPQDFTDAGVKVLTLYFYGDPGNDTNDTEELYVALTGSLAEVRYSDDAGRDMNDLKRSEWTEWNIEISDFIGVDPCAVTSLLIGFGDRDNTDTVGGDGTVYFDDIRLYLPRCIPELGPVADLDGDCIVSWPDIGIVGREWLKSDVNLSPVVAPNDPVLHYAFDESNGTTLFDNIGPPYYDGTCFDDVNQTAAEISGRMDPGRSGNSFHFAADQGYMGIKMPPEVFTDNGISQEITVAVWVKNAHPEELPGRYGLYVGIATMGRCLARRQ